MAYQNAADNDRAETAIDLRARARHDDKRQHAEDRRQRARENGAQPRFEAGAHGIHACHAFGLGLPRARDEQDCVVHDKAEHDDEADHREKIERLKHEETEDAQRDNTADCAERQRDCGNRCIPGRAEQRCHDEEQDEHREREILAHRP